jgi:hypothetical protein
VVGARICLHPSGSASANIKCYRDSTAALFLKRLTGSRPTPRFRERTLTRVSVHPGWPVARYAFVSKLKGREVSSVQCPHRSGRRLQGEHEHRLDHFNHRKSADQIPHRSPCEFRSCCALIRFHTSHSRTPGGNRSFSQQIEIDHLSVRSRCRLLRSSSIFITGLRAGGPRPTEIGGVIQPCRKASNNSASDSSGLGTGLGGPISATTRSRSVTRTVSPPAESRTYLLSLVFSVLRPTERMN